jgi:hypothetical protein
MLLQGRSILRMSQILTDQHAQSIRGKGAGEGVLAGAAGPPRGLAVVFH